MVSYLPLPLSHTIIMVIEKRLKEMGHLESHIQEHFKEGLVQHYRIGDDHEPFLERGIHLSLSLVPRLLCSGSYSMKPV